MQRASNSREAGRRNAAASAKPTSTTCRFAGRRRADGNGCSTFSEWTIPTSRDGQGVRGTLPLTTTMFRSAPRTTRSAVRLLEGSKTSQKLAPPDTSSLRQQHLLLDSSLNSQGRVFVASTSVPTSRLQTRQFTSTSRNFSRRIRSGDRHQSAAFTNERLVGATDDDLPRKSRKANPFLPFQSSSFVDAFVTTIVGIGMSK